MTTDPRGARSSGLLQAFLGGLALAASGALMVARVEPVATWFYSLAWWSWIVLADGLVHARTGRSLLRTTPAKAAALAFASVTFWLVFEAYNLRVRNWYYVGAPPDARLRALGYVVAFATVLPGIFETADLIGAFVRRRGPERPAPGSRAHPASPATGKAIAVLGAVLSVAPLLAPRFLFPLLWIGPTLLLYGLDSPTRGSLHERLRADDFRPLALLLGAGVVTGGIWESANMLARAKWIYTVPFFEGAKLFEMPIPGFLGFPPFAVEGYLFARVLAARAGFGPLWDLGPVTPAGRPDARRAAVAGIASLAVWAAVLPPLDRQTVWSVTPLLAEAGWVPDERRGALAALGLVTAEDLVRASRRDPERVARALGTHAQDAIARAELAALKGIGLEGERLLHAARVTSVARLAEADADDLWTDLAKAAAGTGGRAPTPAQVRVWVRGAGRDVHGR